MEDYLLKIKNLPEEVFERGKIVLKEGNIGSKVYILKDGSVSVYTAGNQICKVNTPGTIFGEISALLSADYSATVIAETDTTFYLIEDLPSLLDKNPKLSIAIARILALRVVNMNSLYAELKHELDNVPAVSLTSHAGKKLYDLLSDMDEFWGKNVFDPLGKKNSKSY